METAGFVDIATIDESIRCDEDDVPLNVASVKVSARKPE